jgi:hypothetical protein
MQERSSFIHLVVYNIMLKTELKMDIISVRLIILKFYTLQNCVVDDVVLICQLVNNVIVDDMDTLLVKRMTYNGSYKYKYS